MKERKIFHYKHPERHQMPVLVDLDGTLAESVWPDPGIGSPLDGAREAIDELKREHGKKIVLFTARASYEANSIRRWLVDNGIMVDEVKTGKEAGEILFDDRAIGFRGDWGKALREYEEIKRRK